VSSKDFVSDAVVFVLELGTLYNHHVFTQTSSNSHVTI